ncbi:DUF4350 domain-containing protein [Ponticaulis sp.]|uniref:DUF4350 domain-containing protein n=1 Tax=Ponticaulis sp. TaxID=2020902 RepID=UPI000B733C77|nr:DUF4350 domain-containing protein [Ponticaulis sp.]MAI88952.1 hypothetical protein [Ponticaulis sp.]OUY01639.1 MAG: hypothetical protein CBB65_00540 [Hyphomonadaceae bacterium TMED5]|tara:strand:+ start:72909 stop:74135 length:1227 start_codon:yes stop_codon:yes gene_type:complete
MERRTDQPSILSIRTAIIAVLVAAVSFGVLVVLSAFAPELRERNSAGLHAYSTSALGYNFAVRLLEDQGYPVTISRELYNLRDRYAEGLLIITPANTVDGQKLAEMNFQGRGQPTLIILPKRWGIPNRANARHYSRTDDLRTEAVQTIANHLGVGLTIEEAEPVSSVTMNGREMPVVFNDHMQTIAGDNFEALLSTSDAAVFGRIANTQTYILSDPELFNTHGLSHLENAEIMMAMISNMTRKSSSNSVMFDVTLHGFEGTRNLLRMMFEPPILGATLFALATAILLGWAAFLRFGRPETEPPAVATGRQSLVESTVSLFSQSRQEVSLVEDYDLLARRMIIRRLGYSEDLSREQMDNILSRREAHLRAKHSDAPAWPDPTQVKNLSQLMQFVRDYHVWNREMSNDSE